MTERERQMIEEYLPSPRDETLEEGEYYYLQETMGGAKVLRVYPLDILPHHEGTEYGLYKKAGNRMQHVDVGWGADCYDRGVRFHDLYDNKDDCRNRTHFFLDEWEDLRKKQLEEEKNA